MQENKLTKWYIPVKMTGTTTVAVMAETRQKAESIVDDTNDPIEFLDDEMEVDNVERIGEAQQRVEVKENTNEAI
jgi:hypothetical protein